MRRRFMSYQDVAADKSPKTRPSSPLGRSGKEGSVSPPSRGVPPSPEGKGPVPGPPTASASKTVAGPADAVRALNGLGRPPSESDNCGFEHVFAVGLVA